MCTKFEKNKSAIFAERFNRLIENREISMEKLAEELNTTKPTLYRWKNGEVYPQAASIAAICDYFHVPKNYFDPDLKERILVDEDLHKELIDVCTEYAEYLDLSIPFLKFLKSSPALADLIVSASYVDAIDNSFSPDVPETESPFQFVSSAGIKIYLPREMLFVLKDIQDDITDFAQFFISKRLKEYEKQFLSDADKYLSPLTKEALDAYKDSEKFESMKSFMYAVQCISSSNKIPVEEAVDKLADAIKEAIQNAKIPPKCGCIVDVGSYKGSVYVNEILVKKDSDKLLITYTNG